MPQGPADLRATASHHESHSAPASTCVAVTLDRVADYRHREADACQIGRQARQSQSDEVQIMEAPEAFCISVEPASEDNSRCVTDGRSDPDREPSLE